jgi:uncharacterized protein (DUF1778 family)
MQRPKRETSLQVRLMADEKEDFEQAAKIAGLSLSAWVRQAMRDRARADLAKAGRKPSYSGVAE